MSTDTECEAEIRSGEEVVYFCQGESSMDDQSEEEIKVKKRRLGVEQNEAPPPWKPKYYLSIIDVLIK